MLGANYLLGCAPRQGLIRRLLGGELARSKRRKSKGDGKGQGEGASIRGHIVPTTYLSLGVKVGALGAFG